MAITIEKIERNREAGFSLIEVLIAMAITGIVMGAVYSAYLSQSRSYINQNQVTEMQQNLRAAMYIMVREIRMAGYDPNGDLNAGITAATNDAFTFTRDDGAGSLDTIIYSYDNANKTLDRNINGGGGQSAAENIAALGFAYAFDADEDGTLDNYTVGGTSVVYWAIDSDADDDLDLHLDTDEDGDINAADDSNADGVINGHALPTDVAFDKIRAVRIWILAETDKSDRQFANTATYIVGDQVVAPASDTGTANHRMRLLTSIVRCRNMGLN